MISNTQAQVILDKLAKRVGYDSISVIDNILCLDYPQGHTSLFYHISVQTVHPIFACSTTNPHRILQSLLELLSKNCSIVFVDYLKPLLLNPSLKIIELILTEITTLEKLLIWLDLETNSI